MKHLFILFILVSLASCKSTSGDQPAKVAIPEALTGSSSVVETLKNNFRMRVKGCLGSTANTFCSYLTEHEQEIMKTMEVVQVDTIKGDKIILAFYQYSVGADIQKESEYLTKRNGKWLVTNQYYSSYDTEDPFKNGRGAEGKALLEKKKEWDENSDKNSIWNR